MKQYLLAASIVLTAASSAAAGDKGSTTYDCEVKSFTNKGWIPPRVIVVVDNLEQTAQVYDGIIHTVYGEPQSAEVKPRDEKSLFLNWRVEGIPVGNVNTTAKAQYSGILNKKNNTLSVRALLSEFGNEPRGRGKCKVKKG
ncbi:hypothetical protein [Leisingera sp. M523]|uniref:hypothetical protein n=1 Tax=Leisingera sp. M523 TaxID=2867013 RepID=UPI0021A60E3B|nr:hypothetical protein [Leisingera sp. M523]UWQ30339.1 hypothetical protein K3557_07350 [Leisingera sp. M523]